VFGVNPRPAMLAYEYRTLIPAPDRYYERQQIDFRFASNWLIGELRGASVQDAIQHIRRKLIKGR